MMWCAHMIFRKSRAGQNELYVRKKISEFIINRRSSSDEVLSSTVIHVQC